MAMVSRKGLLAVEPPKAFNPDDGSPTGRVSFVVTKQQTELLQLGLVMDYYMDGVHLKAGRDTVLVDGKAGLEAWAQMKRSALGKPFTLCPEGQILGYVVNE